MTPDETTETIRALVARIANIPAPDGNADMYLAGFASTAALELLVELEDAFGVAIPDDQFIAARTPSALAQVVCSLAAPGSP